MQRYDRRSAPAFARSPATMECITGWPNRTTKSIQFLTAVSERIIFPVSPNESNGIEDARLCGSSMTMASATYYATYTAYNGA